MKSWLSLSLAVAGGLVATAPAYADTVVVAANSDVRTGLVLGASLQGGNMGCQTKDGEDCGNGAHAAGGLTVHAGGMVTPNIAILGEFWGMAHEHDDITATQVMATANIRGWLVPRLWLQGGVGVARSKISFDSGPFMASDTSSTVPAVDAALGLELIQTPTFGLDVQLRGGSGVYRDDVRIWNASLGVGVSFF